MSQPGVRGKVSSAPGDFITPRYIEPADPRARDLRQAGAAAPLAGPVPARRAASALRAPATVAPLRPPTSRAGPRSARTWSAGVCGRTSPPSGSSPSRPPPRSACPRSSSRRCWSVGGRAARRSCARPRPTMPRSRRRWANNHFIFDDDTRPSVLRPIPGYGGDTFPQAARGHARQSFVRTSRTSGRRTPRQRHRPGQAARQHAPDDPAARHSLRCRRSSASRSRRRDYSARSEV